MKNLKNWINLTEAKSDATTFFHEVICGIACFDPKGAKGINKGADIMKFFVDGTIAAINAGENIIPYDNLTAKRFFEAKDGEPVAYESSKEFWDKGKLNERKTIYIYWF